ATAILAGPALASTGNVRAATAGAAGLQPTLVKDGTDLGAAAGGPMSVTLALPLRNRAALDAFIAGVTTPGSPTYPQFLTPAPFAPQFSPTAAAVSAVTSWAQGAGLTVSSVSSNRTLVRLDGTVASIGRAFNVSFHSYRTPDGVTYRSPSTAATLPSAL